MIPLDHFWTEALFGYSNQTLNITKGNLINQTCQNLEVVNTIESSDSQAFVKILQDVLPQMVSSMKQNINNSMVNSIRQAIDASIGKFEKILQDALQELSKRNEQKSGNYAKNAPKV